MDKIIRAGLVLFIVILVVFVGVVMYNTYTASQFRNSINGTYVYTCTISTSDVMSNITLFLPVPADASGNSPVVAQISGQSISGVPSDWNLTLFDTGKATLLKVSAKSIGLPPVNGTAHVTTVTFAVNVSSPAPIDTATPVDHAAVFRPLQGLHTASCPAGNIEEQNIPQCYKYLTSVYADYNAPASASISISETVTGTNSWTIFSPESNGYTNEVAVPLLQGENHGWVTAAGLIESGMGTAATPSFS